MWATLSNQLMTCLDQKADLPTPNWERGNSPAHCLQTSSATAPLPASPEDCLWIWTASLLSLSPACLLIYFEVAQLCPTAYDPMGCSLLLSSWDFPGRSTGVSCHFLLQRTFPTQGSISGLLHYRQKLYHLSHQGRFSPASLSPSNFGLKSSKITRGYSDR